jgi:hypothetical protein
LQPRCCRAVRWELPFPQGVTNRFVSRSGLERPAEVGDSPVRESDPTPGRVPEYHVEGLFMWEPGRTTVQG